MKLDELQEMAAGEIVDPVTGTLQRNHRGSMRAYHFARALLAMLPVVKAAMEWRHAGPKEHSESVRALMASIDSMCARPGGG